MICHAIHVQRSVISRTGRVAFTYKYQTRTLGVNLERRTLPWEDMNLQELVIGSAAACPRE